MKDAFFALLREVWHLFDSYTNALKVSLLTTVLSYKPQIRN